MKELVIIGAGPAGMSAALYAARKKMDFSIITKEVGGQMVWSSDVDNYIGIRDTTGYELTKMFKEHLKAYDIKITEKEVEKIEKKDKYFVVKTKDSEIETRTVIIASGKRPRKIRATNAERFEGKGISYCATCDAPLYPEKTVAVIGGGNSALDAVLQLEKYASKIYLIVRRDKLRGDKFMSEKVTAMEKVEILFNSEIEEVRGENFLQKIVVKNKDESSRELKLDGVFVEIGHETNSEIIDFVEKDKQGEIKADCNCITSVDGIFAAGDISTGGAKQVVSAAGEGATALISAYNYLNRNE